MFGELAEAGSVHLGLERIALPHVKGDMAQEKEHLLKGAGSPPMLQSSSQAGCDFRENPVTSFHQMKK